MKSSSKKSFAALLVLVCIVAVSFYLMLQASSGDSAVMDELAHIPAGYGYVHNLDYRLNPEHPPLIKAFAALPLLFSNPVFPTDNTAWTTDVNGQWAMGSAFLYESGNDANSIIHAARIFPIFLTLALVILIYIWSSELMGAWWALLPAVLFGLSPNVLAHGHYVTTDVGAAFGIVFASYFFMKFIFAPSIGRLLGTGLVFGVAQLTKFSAVLLIPYFVIVIIFYFAHTAIRDWRSTEAGARLKRFSMRAYEYARSVIIVFLIGYFIVVYPVYFLFTFNYPGEKQAADTEYILTSFAGGPTPGGSLCKPARCLADLDIWMSKNAVTRPFAEYMLGVLMVLQRSDGGNTSYFLGEVSATGSPLYFPVVYLFKETLPSLIIVFTGMLLALWATAKKTGEKLLGVPRYFFIDYLGTNFAEFSMLVFVVFYWAYSVRSPLNIGVRHLMPTFPFIYILAAGAWKKWSFGRSYIYGGSFWSRMKSYLESKVEPMMKSAMLVALIPWFLFETAASAPHFLSYFNEMGGSVYGGYRIVTDSNYDWGQDLIRLQEFVKEHPEIDKIAVDYFGGGSPKYYLGDKEIDWRSSMGNPATGSWNMPPIHWLAVSVNTLQNAMQPLAPGQGRDIRDEYGWLSALRPANEGIGNVPEPDFRAGTSIFIYKL